MGRITRTTSGRLPRALPASHMQTYKIVAPHDKAVISACEAAGCTYWRTGWDTIVPSDSDHARFIRSGATQRSYRELQAEGGLAVFRFDPYQRCFQDHGTIPERFAVVGGDYRGNPRGTPPRIHQRPEDWVEDMAHTLDDVREAQKKG